MFECDICGYKSQSGEPMRTLNDETIEVLEDIIPCAHHVCPKCMTILNNALKKLRAAFDSILVEGRATLIKRLALRLKGAGI